MLPWIGTSPPAAGAAPATLAVESLQVAVPPPVLTGGTAWVEVDAALACPADDESRLLVASLDEPMPAGTWLEVEVVGGGREGSRRLSTRGLNLLVRLPSPTAGVVRLRYRFVHDVVAVPGVFTRTVLFTLISP